jgi:hypothetical protein
MSITVLTTIDKAVLGQIPTRGQGRPLPAFFGGDMSQPQCQLIETQARADHEGPAKPLDTSEQQQPTRSRSSENHKKRRRKSTQSLTRHAEEDPSSTYLCATEVDGEHPKYADVSPVVVAEHTL